MNSAQMRHVERIRDRHVPRTIELQRRAGVKVQRRFVDGDERRKRRRVVAGMDEDHAVPLARDEALARKRLADSGNVHATIVVLPMMQRALQAIADDVSAREVDTLMLAMRGNRAHDAVIASAKHDERMLAEIEAHDAAAT